MAANNIRPCPLCKKPAGWDNNKWRPFCSERCKMIDLGFWAMGEYKIAGEKLSKEVKDEKNSQENEDKIFTGS